MRGALILEDGSVFVGQSFGHGSPQAKEVVCVSGAGWNDVLASPSFAGQIVVCVDAHEDNRGVSSEQCYPSGLLLNGVAPAVAGDLAYRWGVSGLSGVDTKALSAHLLKTGPLAGTLVSDGVPQGPAPAWAAATRPGRYSTAKPEQVSIDRPYRIYGGGPRVVVYDLGLGPDLLSWLVGRDCQVTVVPWDYPAEDVMEICPDVVVLSGGPGNPACCDDAVAAFRPLLGQFPLLGVGLGHQLLARSQGGRTGQMWCGHRGRDVMVRELDTGLTYPTAQSHGYCVLGSPSGSRVSHVAVADGSIEGLEYPGLNAWSVQFTPGGGSQAAAANPMGRVWHSLLSAAGLVSLSAS